MDSWLSKCDEKVDTNNSWNKILFLIDKVFDEYLKNFKGGHQDFDLYKSNPF